MFDGYFFLDFVKCKFEKTYGNILHLWNTYAAICVNSVYLHFKTFVKRNDLEKYENLEFLEKKKTNLTNQICNSNITT